MESDSQGPADPSQATSSSAGCDVSSASAGHGRVRSRSASIAQSFSRSLGRIGGRSRRGSEVYNPATEIVPIKVKIALGLGESCQAIYTFIAGFHLNVYLLEIVCLPASYVGTLQLVAGLWDTFNDPFIGSLSDKTRTRWGRRRPWLLFGSPPLGAAFFGLWYRLPLDVPNVYKMLYYLMCYMILSACITSIQVQVGALTPELTKDYDERTVVSTYRLVVANIISLISVFCMTQITEVFDASERYKGYIISGVIFGGLMTCCGLACFCMVYERYNPENESERSLPILEGLRYVFKNRAFVCVVLVYLFGCTATVTVQTNLVLYLKYILNAEDQFSYFIAIVQGGVMGSLPFWSWFSKKHGKKEMYYVGASIVAASLPMLFVMKFMPAEMMFVTIQRAPLLVWFSYVVCVLAGVSLSVVYLAPYSMLPDVIEVDELQTGKRREGVYFGFFTVFMKLSTTSTLALSTYALGMAGYEAPAASCGGLDNEELAPTQPEAVEWLLCIMVGPFPSMMILIAIYICYKYPITREVQAQMVRDAHAQEHANRHKRTKVMENQSTGRNLTAKTAAVLADGCEPDSSTESSQSVDTGLNATQEPGTSFICEQGDDGTGRDSPTVETNGIALVVT